MDLDSVTIYVCQSVCVFVSANSFWHDRRISMKLVMDTMSQDVYPLSWFPNVNNIRRGDYRNVIDNTASWYRALNIYVAFIGVVIIFLMKCEVADLRFSQCWLCSSILWDITLCSPLKVNRRFERIRPLHIQGRRISQARNQREAVDKQSSVWPSTDYTALYPTRYNLIIDTEINSIFRFLGVGYKQWIILNGRAKYVFLN
jgi:hypothetical protein